MVWFLRRFGLKTGTDFPYFGLNSSMVFEEMHERICSFNSKLMNKKKTVICEVEVDFKKSFCWRSNVSNDNIISAYARSENGYGFYEDKSGNGCGKNNFLVRKKGQDLENRVAHPHDESPGISPR